VDIEAKVMEKYPLLPTEANCRTERDFRNRARDSYRLKLLQLEREAAGTVQQQAQPPDETIRKDIL
jgi:hypothetical protein